MSSLGALGARALSNDAAEYALSNYFDGAFSNYWVSENPSSNASLLDGVLRVEGSYRGQAYVVAVRASNALGEVASNALSVTEVDSAPPTVTTPFGSLNLCNQIYRYGLSNYFSDPQRSPISYWISTNTLSNASIADDVLVVNSTWRARSNVPYRIVVSASNPYASNQAHPVAYVSSNVLNANAVATRAPVATPFNLTLSNNVADANLSSHVVDSQGSPLTYWLTSSPLSNASIVGSTLRVHGSNRGLVYGLSFSASNAFSQTSTGSVNVVEFGHTGSMSRGGVPNWNVLGSLTVGPDAVSATSPAQYPVWVQTANSNSVSIFTAGDVTAFSDERCKVDVEPITDALEKVSRIGGYTFRRADDARGEEAPRRAGVIAQEVREVLPEVIDEGPDGMMHVAYGNLAALMIEAVKELRDQQASLSNAIYGR